MLKTTSAGRQGITPRSILMALTTDHLTRVSKDMLNPRRRSERENEHSETACVECLYNTWGRRAGCFVMELLKRDRIPSSEIVALLRGGCSGWYQLMLLFEISGTQDTSPSCSKPRLFQVLYTQNDRTCHSDSSPTPCQALPDECASGQSQSPFAVCTFEGLRESRGVGIFGLFEAPCVRPCVCVCHL